MQMRQLFFVYLFRTLRSHT